MWGSEVRILSSRPFSYFEKFGYLVRLLASQRSPPIPILEALIGPLAAIIDKVIPDKRARNMAKLELLQ